MKEILFRGKTDGNYWVEGSLILAGDYCCILEDESQVHPMDYPYLDSLLGIIDGQATPVDRKTVGQYVGLKDANGRKIFEGDILESPVKPVSEKHGHLTLVTDIRSCKFIALYAAGHRVIGNVWDDPELLTTEEEIDFDGIQMRNL